MYALKSSEARRQYPKRLKMLFDYLKLSEPLEEQAIEFLNKAKQNSAQWAQYSIMTFLDFHKERVRRKELAAGTLKYYYRAAKLFCEMNDLTLNWKRISKGLPRAKSSSNDRAPTIEEICKLVEYPDRRIKPIVYCMASGGFRLGAWDYLSWRHVSPITNDDAEVIAAKVRIYADEPEEYYTFITPEAYFALKDWMEFRISYGEKITGDSWIMRDLWQTTNMNYGARWGLATNPKKLQSIAVKRLLGRALWEQGVRCTLPSGVKHYEWKGAHGYRKFYKSRAEQTMKPINVEITMGHDLGVSESYWRPTEREVLEDYLKAVPLLTINENNLVLQKQVEELNEKTNNNDYLLRAKLQEKDDAYATLSDQVMKLMVEVQELKKKQIQS
jgi:integrase